MKTKITFLGIILLLGLIGCKKDHYYKKNGMVQIYSSTIADTVLQNESTAIKITASAANGCWSNPFVNLKGETSFDYSIKAYGTFSCRHGGCACPDLLVGMDTVINFQPTQKGKYTFNVYTSQDSITIESRIVN